MTTSSEQTTTNAKPRPSGDHWFEMTATLCRDQTQQLGQWMDESLRSLESSLERYSSPDSRGESAGRR